MFVIEWKKGEKNIIDLIRKRKKRKKSWKINLKTRKSTRKNFRKKIKKNWSRKNIFKKLTLQQKVRYDEEMLKRDLKKIEILKRPKSALNVDDDDDDVFKVCPNLWNSWDGISLWITCSNNGYSSLYAMKNHIVSDFQIKSPKKKQQQSSKSHCLPLSIDSQLDRKQNNVQKIDDKMQRKIRNMTRSLHLFCGSEENRKKQERSGVKKIKN